MTSRTRTLAVLCGVMLLTAIAAILVSTSRTAAAPPVEFDIDLGSLVPGVPVTSSTELEVPADATVVRSEWVQLDGLAQDIEWVIELCGAPGCIDVEPTRTGAAVPAGVYTLSVTGELVTDQVGSGRAVGVVGLMADDDAGGGGTGLPVTGGPVPWLAIVFAGSALAAGITAVVIAVRGRRRS